MSNLIFIHMIVSCTIYCNSAIFDEPAGFSFNSRNGHHDIPLTCDIAHIFDLSLAIISLANIAQSEDEEWSSSSEHHNIQLNRCQ